MTSPLRTTDKLDTHQKALAVNLDARRYGTFAEIGAGQEVVRWFFRVGGAAGTIAKSISAYDMAVSDAIYGRTQRYVCRQRLESMLAYEHKLNLERLRDARGDTTSFFVFADTVAAKSYKGTNECHGWLGVRFQAHPRDQDSQVIIHVRLLDSEMALQQEALGVVGVNLLYGAFFMHHDPDRLLESLLDNLTTDRIEIDMVEFSGIEFRHVDNRVMALKLVQLGLSGAAIFDPKGEVLQPSELLRKNAVLVERGTFLPVTRVHLDMLHSAHKKFSKQGASKDERVIELMEINMRNLIESGQGGVDLRDFLARADVLAAAGKTVIISDYFEYYRLAGYLRRYTQRPIALVLGAGSLAALFDEKYYTNLDGGILEAFGRLFKNDTKLYVYPSLDATREKLMTASSFEPHPELSRLYGHLLDRGCIVELDEFDRECLSIFSTDVLRMIRSGDASWERAVPPEVIDVIKKGSFFGHRRAQD
ncbi:MAG: TonB-dependent receptor [Myxococcota bacterium]